MPDPDDPLGDMVAIVSLSITAGAAIGTLLDQPNSRASRNAAAQTLNGLPTEDLTRIERAAAALTDVTSRALNGRPGVITGTTDSYPIGEIDA